MFNQFNLKKKNYLFLQIQTTGDFKDDFKQYWMPDEHCKECYECGDKFNTFRRRHHCRVCGQIFCYKCCNLEVHGKIIGFSGKIFLEFTCTIILMMKRESVIFRYSIYSYKQFDL